MLQRNQSDLSTQVSRLSQRLYLIAGILVILGCFVLWFYNIGNPFGNVTIAVGTSLLASLLLNTLYGRIAEQNVSSQLVTECTKASVDYLMQILRERFTGVLPAKTYSKAQRPTEEFREEFVLKLTHSRFYHHKGDGAGFAAFRLYKNKNHPALTKKESIQFCILDPSDHQLMKQNARRELHEEAIQWSEEDLQKRTDQNRIAQLITILTIYEVRHSLRVRLFLHRQPAFCRTELFEGGLFLSFYLGGEYPATYQYEPRTYPYDAYSLDFLQTAEASQELSLQSVSETDFEKVLRGYVDGITLSELKRLRDEKYRALEERIFFSLKELF